MENKIFQASGEAAQYALLSSTEQKIKASKKSLYRIEMDAVYSLLPSGLVNYIFVEVLNALHEEQIKAYGKAIQFFNGKIKHLSREDMRVLNCTFRERNIARNHLFKDFWQAHLECQKRKAFHVRLEYITSSTGCRPTLLADVLKPAPKK